MQGFLRTPWNATSSTTAQDALWQHILDRNTSSQPFMTPCACQVMNRIPGNVTPPWAGCWGPLHSCWWMMNERSNAAQRNRQPARPTPRPRPPPHPDKVSRVTFAHNMESSSHWRFLRFPVARRGRCNSGISSGLIITQVQSTFATGDNIMPVEHTADCFGGVWFKSPLSTEVWHPRHI